jgi:hypothetical protein
MTSPGGKEVGRISIRVVPDTGNFRRDLKRQLDAIEKEVRATVNVDVNLDAAGAKARMRTLMAELKAQAARGVKVNVGVDGAGALSRGLANLGNGLSGALGSVNPASILLVVAAASLLAPALALVSGALVGLPALLAAVAVPAGAVALGLDGLKRAAGTLAPDLDALKATMSARFEETFTPVFQRLKSIFPALAQELPKVTEGLATLAGGLVDAVTSEKGMASIRNTIGNIGQALKDAAPGVRDFTSGLLTMVSQVSNRLPGLATMFSDFAGRFAAWVDKISTVDASGTSPLQRGMTGLKETLQSILDLVAQLGTKGFDFLANDKMGEKIAGVVNSLNTLVTDTLPNLNNMFTSLAATVQTISDRWNSIKWVIAPDQALQDKLGLPNASTFQQIADLWNGVKQQVMNGLANILAAAATLPGQVASAWSSLGSVAASAWSTVTQTVTQVMAEVVAAVVSGAGQIVAEISSWPGKFVGALGDTGSLLVDAGRNLVQGLINGITGMIGSAIAAAANLAGQVAAAAKGALGIHSPSKVFTDIGAQTMQGLENGIDDGSKAVVDKMGTLGKDMQTALNDQLAKIMTGTLDIGKNFGMANLQQFESDLGWSGNGAIPQIASAVLDWGMGQLNGAITSAIQPVSQGQGQGQAQPAAPGVSIHVNSVDEALAARQNIVNKQALQYVQR